MRGLLSRAPAWQLSMAFHAAIFVVSWIALWNLPPIDGVRIDSAPSVAEAVLPFEEAAPDGPWSSPPEPFRAALEESAGGVVVALDPQVDQDEDFAPARRRGRGNAATCPHGYPVHDD